MTTAKKKTTTRKPATARKRPATSKTKIQVVKEEVKVVDPHALNMANQSIELSEALVNEVDNLMQSNLPPAQVGKVLGDIVSSFSNQVKILKQQLSD